MVGSSLKNSPAPFLPLPQCFPKSVPGSVEREKAHKYDAPTYRPAEVDLPVVQGWRGPVALALVIFGVWLISAWIK
jgi:hypothetical protein